MCKREVSPFTNDFGQVINPGDEVVVVTTCTGNTNTQKGKYVGMRGKSVQAEVEYMKYEWYNKETNEIGSYYKIPTEQRAIRRVPAKRITTLQYNRIYKLAA